MINYKNIYYIAILTLFIMSCVDKQQKEVIVEKWGDGTPKKVNYIVGEGVKQEIVGRITYYENGDYHLKESFKNQKKDGWWIKYFENGKISSKSHYKDGKLHGEIIKYYVSGELLSVRNCKNGERLGEAISYYKNGQIKEVGYYKDLLNRWYKYEDDGLKYDNGYFITNYFTEDGNILIKDGHGKLDEYEFGYLTAKTNYENGKKNGEFKNYHRNSGIIKTEGDYKDGIIEGQWTSYYKSGQIKEERIYKNREYLVLNIWDNSGEITVKNGNGEWTDYSEGRVIGKGNYRDGKKEGKEIFYYPNDQIYYEKTYTNGKRDGLWLYYKKNGRIDKVEYYKDGKQYEEENRIEIK